MATDKERETDAYEWTHALIDDPDARSLLTEHAKKRLQQSARLKRKGNCKSLNEIKQENEKSKQNTDRY